jgi:bacterioferritin
MDMDDIIRILNENFMRELEATLIYARNSFIMRDCASSRVTEAIAVDEMRHMWWLADLITKRGGKPSMEHKELDFGGDDLNRMLEKQISLETDGIENYKKQIEIVKRRRRTHAQQAAGHPRRRRMKMEPGRADPSLS